MEIFQQVFKGATAAELAKATAPIVARRQPGQSRRANIVRPKGDARRKHSDGMIPEVVDALPTQHEKTGFTLVCLASGSGMANERAALERQQQKLRQGSAGPPARHARFGGLFVRRYNAEDRGSVVRSNPLVSDLPAIPELKKTSKTMVIISCCFTWSLGGCCICMLFEGCLLVCWLADVFCDCLCP